ncbi:MotA/TolQ/ExbB proton channel family protein [Crateriforma conspicua]|uniref:MotA/TolQ/ExbB proton channel family protein n=1 Tax=Crateriforma conspicua TaxID=2527996 RepID=UPI0036F26E41
MRPTRRLKTVAALAFFACMVGSALGTVLSMMRSFDAIASGTQPVSPAELSDSMNRSLTTGMLLIPIALVAAVVWLICWRRMRQPLTIGLTANPIRTAQDHDGG